MSSFKSGILIDPFDTQKRDSEGKRAYHIHMVERDSELWDRLYFRDYLRQFPEKAELYGKLKEKLLAGEEPEKEKSYARDLFVIEIIPYERLGLWFLFLVFFTLIKQKKTSFHDLKNDPAEQHDVAAQNADVGERLKSHYDSMQAARDADQRQRRRP